MANQLADSDHFLHNDIVEDEDEIPTVYVIEDDGLLDSGFSGGFDWGFGGGLESLLPLLFIPLLCMY